MVKDANLTLSCASPVVVLTAPSASVYVVPHTQLILHWPSRLTHVCVAVPVPIGSGLEPKPDANGPVLVMAMVDGAISQVSCSHCEQESALDCSGGQSSAMMVPVGFTVMMEPVASVGLLMPMKSGSRNMEVVMACWAWERVRELRARARMEIVDGILAA